MRTRDVLAISTLVGCVSGCVEAFGDRSPYEPGEALGKFHVVAKEVQNGCGAGALGAPEVWEFDLRLAWEDDSLFWDSGGEVIVGTLSADRATFEIAAEVVQDMRTEADAGLPPCSIARHDVAKGTLVPSEDGVSAVTGTLSYDFTPTADSICSDLVEGEAPVLAALPCGITYSFEAARTGD